jgi:hypothetical protein
MALQHEIQHILTSSDEQLLKQERTLQQLIDYIRSLLLDQPDQLVQLLYRVDIDEAKVKEALKTTNQDHAIVIANMILERLQKTLQTRKTFSSRNPNDSNEEKW